MRTIGSRQTAWLAAAAGAQDTSAAPSDGHYLRRTAGQLAAKQFEGVTPELRDNILSFYAAMKTPDPHGIDAQLAALKALSINAIPRAPSQPPVAIFSTAPLP